MAVSNGGELRDWRRSRGWDRALSVARARKDYQTCRYAELISRLPRLLGQLDTACRCLTGGDRRRACALSADAYHVTAGFLLKTGDPGLAHVATDRSMTAALASQDPLTVGASGRIVTHTLMSSGHLTAAVTTAQNHAVRLDRETGVTTPESLSVYGSLLLRGALAAAQRDDRAIAQPSSPVGFMAQWTAIAEPKRIRRLARASGSLRLCRFLKRPQQRPCSY